MQEIKSSLEINNLTDFDISEDFLYKILRSTLSKTSLDCLTSKEVSLSLAIVSEDEIRKLNFQYRKKDSPTDVLSFSEYAKIQDLCDNELMDVFLGEIILCPEYIKQSSREQGVSLNYEIAYIFSHGILHLLGLDHGKEMFSIQEEIAGNIK